MAEVHREIDGSIETWIREQKMFFVATAPKSKDGLVNCSPKGLNTLRVLGPMKMAYADLNGSGVETIAHVKQNARILIMMCALESHPKIFRFHGHARIVEPHTAEYVQLLHLFPPSIGIPAIIVVDLKRIPASCGSGVPLFEYRRDRDALSRWLGKRGEEALLDHRLYSNHESIDGLPGTGRFRASVLRKLDRVMTWHYGPDWVRKMVSAMVGCIRALSRWTKCHLPSSRKRKGKSA